MATHTPPADPAPPYQNADAIRLLVVDDETTILRSLVRALRGCAETIRTAGSAEEALESLEADADVHVVISDCRMPGMDGVTLLQRVRERWPHIQRILLTGYADQHAIEDAINRAEVYRYITKPWEDGHLQATVQSAFEQQRIVQENARLLTLVKAQNATLEMKVAERTRLLSVAKAEWELSFDAIRDPMAVIESGHIIKRANRAYARLAGRPVDQVPGGLCHAVLFERASKCEGCQVQKVLADGNCRSFSCHAQDRHFKVSAHRLPADGATPDRAVVYYRDVTEEEALTRQLIQTEKMAAVGQLAGGVAHEINNPLAGILAFSQMMKEEERSADDLEQLGYIESSAKRCMRIVESLLSFSRSSGEDERGSVDLEAMLGEVQVLVHTLLGGRAIEVEYDVAPDLPELRGSPGPLTQVLVNLVTNAVQAVADPGSVRVRIRSSGDGIRITVEDSGPGIDESVAGRIFEPFFTTKPEGKGTGLGLAISYRIVESHGGTIGADRSPDLRGARFTLDLPTGTGERDD